jgi:glutathione synthase/RimK-type ligase-like ATP-grasp enzyme
MTNGSSDRLDRVEHLLENFIAASVADRQASNERMTRIEQGFEQAFNRSAQLLERVLRVQERTLDTQERTLETQQQHEARLARMDAVISRLDTIIERMVYREGRDGDSNPPQP